MQWDTISDQWLWLIASAVFLVLLGALVVYFFHRPKAYDATKPYDASESQDGWVATGRVDFFRSSIKWQLYPSGGRRRELSVAPLA